MNLTDICLNLSNSQFKSDIDEVLDRAKAAMVSRLLVVGTDLESSQFCADWAERYEQLFATAGVHPHDADNVPNHWLDEIRTLALQDNVVAVGETGIDLNRNYSSREGQVACFRDQISLAVELRMPLFVHDRESDGLVLEMLQNFDPALGVVIHCFTGTEVELENYLSAGYSIGITGWICDVRRGQNLREMIATIPLEQLLIETDAPFLRPHNTPKDWLDHHSLSNQFKRRCEPAMLPFVLQTVAEHRTESIEDIAAATHRNATRLFNLPE